MARQEHVAEMLRALAAGADIHPPLDYILRHFCMQFFGTGELADRLPSILAFWVMCLALRRMVAFRCGEVFGLVAFLAPLVTLAYEYSYEGRGYALMLAGSALALAGWQAAAEGRQRRVSLGLMGLGLAIAVTVHYYGLFILIPLVAGEVVRAGSRRRMDWTLSLVAAGSALMFLLNMPYLIGQAAQTGKFWSTPNISETIQAYWWLFNEMTLVVPVFLVLAAAVCVLDRSSIQQPRTLFTIPTHEWSVAAATLFVPVACFLLARFVTGAFYYRYVLVTILGLVLLGVYVAHYTFAGKPRLRVVLLLAVALAGAYEMVKTMRQSDDPGIGRMRQAALESALPGGDLPVVHGTRTSFMEATHYAAPGFRSNMYYLTDREASLKWVGNDNGQLAMANIAPFVPGHVMDYETFLGQHRHFLLVNPRLEKDWILPRLLEDGAQILYRSISGENVVLEVRMPSVPSE